MLFPELVSAEQKKSPNNLHGWHIASLQLSLFHL